MKKQTSKHACECVSTSMYEHGRNFLLRFRVDAAEYETHFPLGEHITSITTTSYNLCRSRNGERTIYLFNNDVIFLCKIERNKYDNYNSDSNNSLPIKYPKNIHSSKRILHFFTLPKTNSQIQFQNTPIPTTCPDVYQYFHSHHPPPSNEKRTKKKKKKNANASREETRLIPAINNSRLNRGPRYFIPASMNVEPSHPTDNSHLSPPPSTIRASLQSTRRNEFTFNWRTRDGAPSVQTSWSSSMAPGR